VPALSEDQLQAIISNQIALAKTFDRTERETPRAKAIDYFLGNMDKYVPPETNRSKVVSRDVADTISRMLPGILRVFTASDRMAVAEPVGPEDEEFARQATDGMNYVFWKDNDGYQIVYDATWDALLNGNGIVKTFYDDTPVYSTSFHTGLMEDQVALLLQDEGVEVLAQTARQEMIPDSMGGEVSVTLYDLKIKRKKADGSFVVDCIPPEEFLIHGDTINTDDSPFSDHWQRKTRSDLVAMGYDKDEVAAIPEAGKGDTEEAIARLNSAQNNEATDTSMQLVDYHECFLRVDVDGDGEAELVRACYGGSTNGKLLDWEVWEDEGPFDDIKCEPIPHRWVARSVADETIDIQDVKTVLIRQFLNNVYWANNPQRFVTGKVKNPDQLDTPTFGGTVFGDPGTTVTNLDVPFVGEAALAGVNLMDEVAQRRTGVSRQTMALDPDALQNETAESVRDRKDSSYAQTEIIARNMASGWSKVFRKLLKLMTKHQEHARTVMFNGKPVVIDPRYWNADMNVTINVGLGTGSRDRDLAMLGNVLQSQLMLADRFMAAGAMDDAIDMLPKIIETMTKMAESAGIKNPEDYYPEYTEEKVAKLKALAAEKAKQPSPQVQLEQMKQQGAAQQSQVDAQVTMQVEQGKNQLAQQQAMMDSEAAVRREQAQLEADMITKDRDRENAIILERIRQEGAERLKMMDIAYQREKDANAAQLQREGMANSAGIAAQNNAARAAMKPKPQPNA
jgi:hypothetical protein